MTDIQNDINKTAETAARNGMSPSDIADVHVPSPHEMHARIQQLEAIVHHIVTTYYRNTNVEQVVKEFMERGKNNKVLDDTVKGRA